MVLPMTVDQFWEIVDRVYAGSGGSNTEYPVEAGAIRPAIKE